METGGNCFEYNPASPSKRNQIPSRKPASPSREIDMIKATCNAMTIVDGEEHQRNNHYILFNTFDDGKQKSRDKKVHYA